MDTVITGFITGLGLIIAIGAQNVFVLRQGIRREHVGLVVAVCAISDIVLICAGVAGLGFLVEAVPGLITAARLAGAVFLLAYAGLAAHRAVTGTDGLQASTSESPSASTVGSLKTDAGTRILPVVATAAALTWLNPHVYLDTVFLLGSIASTHGDDRWLFAAGAVCASLVWFSALGFGARALGRSLRTPSAWRVLDATIAILMAALAVKLLTV